MSVTHTPRWRLPFSQTILVVCAEWGKSRNGNGCRWRSRLRWCSYEREWRSISGNIRTKDNNERKGLAGGKCEIDIDIMQCCPAMNRIGANRNGTKNPTMRVDFTSLKHDTEMNFLKGLLASGCVRQMQTHSHSQIFLWQLVSRYSDIRRVAFRIAAGQGNGNGADPIESNRIGRDFRCHSATGVAKRGSGDWDVCIPAYLTKFMVDKEISDDLQNT